MSQKPDSCKNHSYGRAPRGAFLPRSGSMRRWNYEYDNDEKNLSGHVDDSLVSDFPRYRKLIQDIRRIFIAFDLITIFAGFSALLLAIFSHWNIICFYFLLALLFLYLLFVVLFRCFVRFTLEFSPKEIHRLSYDARYQALASLASCNQLWWVKSETPITYERVEGGANSSVSRKEARMSSSCVPFFLKSNVSLLALKYRKFRFVFLPDALLAFEGQKVKAIPYSEISINQTVTNFRETDFIPNDTTRSGSTWAYVNKDGSPDRRFNNNYVIPIVLYCEMKFFCKNTLLFTLMASSGNKANLILPFFRFHWLD
jgi:hypothetical protein